MSDYLVKLAKLFELRCNKILNKSITKLAEYPSLPFRTAMYSLVGAPIGNDNFNRWLDINKQFLKSFPEHKDWFYAGNKLFLSLDNSLVVKIVTLSEKSKIEKELDIKQISLLIGVYPIPSLYLIEGKYKSDSDFNIEALIEDSSLAHDAFIIRAIKYLLKIDNIDYYKKYLIENKNILDKIKRSFEEIPKYLGGGIDGIAFSIGPNKVLKLFTSSFAYTKANEAMIRLHKNPELAKTEAMIYDVGIISKEPFPLYYYIMEKMKPVSSLPKEVETSLYNIIDEIDSLFRKKLDIDPKLKNLMDKFDDPTSHKQIKEVLPPIINSIVSSLKIRLLNDLEIIEYGSRSNLSKNWVPSLVEELIIKYISKRTDLHLGNMGVTNYGEFRYFDPAYQS